MNCVRGSLTGRHLSVNSACVSNCVMWLVSESGILPGLAVVLVSDDPDKQTYKRGMKLIEATSHYVTTDLDEGPIIEHDTLRVTHAQSADDYISSVRDVESQVLARAFYAHVQRRVFLNGNKTVVFLPSPGSHTSSRVG